MRPTHFRLMPRHPSADRQVVGALERGTAPAADYGQAVAANERILDFLGAFRTIELDAGR
jgi:hypothetical protein